MRILVTGVSGMLGHPLARLAVERHEVWGSYASFPVSLPGVRTFAMDLADRGRMAELVGRIRPDAIVHAAALTDVDACEADPGRAKLINAVATENLAALARKLDSRFVYISTDYVFDGERGDYTEADPPRPVNAYGESKLLGEQGAQSGRPEALVIRTSIVGFNTRPKTGQVEYVIQSLKRGVPFGRFSDQFWTPIYTADLSRLIFHLLDRDASGLFHVGGGEKVSRYEFARKVADAFSLPRELIRPTSFGPVPGAARRPRDSSLRGERVERYLGIRLPDVASGLARLKDDFAAHLRTEEA